jgi:hemolysin activation/secretion protein
VLTLERMRATFAGGRALALAIGLGLASPALAQPQVPAGVGENQSQSPQIDRDRSDRVAPALPAAPNVSIARPAAPGVAAAATAVALTRVRFEGASLAPAALGNATAAFIGQPLTQPNLKAIADAVGKAYAASDIAYYSVAIPAQTPVGGVLTVRVVEGAVKRYAIKGVSETTPTKLVEAHIARIMKDTPLRKSVLERSLSLMRDMPGQTVEARIGQIDASGALLLEIDLKRKPINISVTIDNNGVSNVISAFQAQVAVTVNGLAREGDSTRVSSYLPIHPDRYKLYTASHSTPIGTNGMTATISGARVESRSNNGVEGQATLAGLSLNYPLIRSYKTNVSLTASLDGIDSSNYYLDTRFGDYRSRALRVGGSWSKADAKNGYAVSAVVSHGLDILNAKAFAGFSETGFTKANVQAVAVRTVAKNLVAKVTATGQYSRDKLPVTERLSLGGPGAGRAYRVGTITADRGATAMIELSWTLPKVPDRFKGSALFGFVDGATGHVVARPLYGLPAQSSTLASAGGGVRVGLGKWRASVEVAVPVKRPAASYSRSARVFAGFGRSF